MPPERRPLSVPSEILVVDPDAESLAFLTATLLQAGHSASAASGIDEALSLLQEGIRPDLIVFDLPGLTEHLSHLAMAVRQRAGDSPIPFLALVTTEPDAATTVAQELGVGDFLIRPFTATAVQQRVCSLLRVKDYCTAAAEDLRRLTEVALGLSAERNLTRLLERILDEARGMNLADAGTLYLVDPKARVLLYEILHNDTLGTRIGGISGVRVDLPPVPLQREYVSAYVALTGATVNIPDVYEAGSFDFSGPRKYDAITGYRSRSMLVVPIWDHERTIVGVLQLINAMRSDTREVVPFLGRNVARTQALASQAGIAITNARLIADLQAYFEGLVHVMASAVDEKSAHTSGHIRRVTRLACLLAEAVNRCDPSEFDGQQFTADELEELRIAGLLHDIGKIVVPEYLVDKATKLQTVFDRIELLRTRFDAIRRSEENKALLQKLQLLSGGGNDADLAAIDAALAAGDHLLREDLAFLESLNRGGEKLAQENVERVRAIACRTYTDTNGFERPYLTEDEVQNLSIVRGTLLPEELAQIRNHAAVTIRLLNQIPFGNKLRNVPVYAGDHHEMLNGSGYPQGKTAAQLPLQSRILAVTDIFDALTASDRPYRRADPYENACAILREEAARGRLDSRLVELFIRAGCFRRMQYELGIPPEPDS